MRTTHKNERTYLSALLVLLAAVLPYLGLLGADFVRWDDHVYVTENERVLNGLTPDNAAWAFSTVSYGFYYPVTWISHMLDISLFGTNPAGHHLTSILIHAANALLLFAFFRRALGDCDTALFVPLIFAVHPLNVESVAWISERKNVLAGLFFFLAMNLYLVFARKPSLGGYLKTFAAYVLGLLSKPVAVTLPVSLLLVDLWPAQRVPPDRQEGRRGFFRCVLEKLPMLLPVPFFAWITVAAQKQEGALAGLEKYPLADRIAGAVISTAKYAWQFIFPLDLTPFFPHRGSGYTAAEVAVSALTLSAMFAVFAAVFRKRALYMASFLWFLVNLSPVIGIIQVGEQGAADRYMYIPMVGLAVIAVSALHELPGKFPRVRRPHLAAFLAAACLLLALKTVDQCSVWKNSRTLFTEMIETSPNPCQGHVNMGGLYKSEGDLVKAAEHFRKAIEADPGNAQGYINLGDALCDMKDYRGAREAFVKAAEIAPGNPVNPGNLGYAEEMLGDLEAAERNYRKALSADKNYKISRLRLALVLDRKGETEAALALCDEGASLAADDPDHARLKCSILLGRTMWAEAKAAAVEGLGRFPGDPNIHWAYGEACLRLGELAEAERGFLEVARLSPKSSGVYYKLAEIAGRLGRDGEARAYAAKAAALNSGN